MTPALKMLISDMQCLKADLEAKKQVTSSVLEKSTLIDLIVELEIVIDFYIKVCKEDEHG